MKELRVSRISNLRRGLTARGAAIVVPALIGLFALGGVTARPALDASRAAEELELAKKRVDECRTEREQWERHREARTFEVAEALRARLRSRIPEDLTDVVAHGTLRMVAERRGVPLDRLQIGTDRDPGLPRDTERIVLRDVALTGRASLKQLVGLVDDLRALGFPTCINEVNLRRTSARDDFEFNLVLGLMHFVPVSDDQSQAPTAQEQP